MIVHQCYIYLVDLIEFSGFSFFGSNATVTSAMSLLERIFFWRPDALPLLGGIKASKHMTASSSSLLPFVRVRQCVTSGDSKNKQKMCFVAGGGGGGGVPCWLEPLANYSLPAEPHSSQGGMLLLEEFFEFPHLLSLERFFPTYSPPPPHSSGGY